MHCLKFHMQMIKPNLILRCLLFLDWCTSTSPLVMEYWIFKSWVHLYIFSSGPKVNDFTAHIKCSYYKVSKFVTICGKILVWFKIFFSTIEAIKFLSSSALYSSKVKSCKHKKCAQCELQFDWLQKLTPIWFSFLPEGIINIFFFAGRWVLYVRFRIFLWWSLLFRQVFFVVSSTILHNG